MTADTVFYEELTLDILQNYRGFIFFRCPVTDTVRKFIEQAKFFNKSCFFDVDDLVIDTKVNNKEQVLRLVLKGFEEWKKTK